VAKALGAVLLLVGAVALVTGAGWVFLDAVGSEWDYCRGDGDECIAGWKIGAGFTLVGVVAVLVGLRVVHGERQGSGRGSA
jgi:hypothetical protein